MTKPKQTGVRVLIKGVLVNRAAAAGKVVGADGGLFTVPRVEGKYFGRGCQVASGVKGLGTVVKMRVFEGTPWERVEDDGICEAMEKEAKAWKRDVKRSCGWQLRWAEQWVKREGHNGFSVDARMANEEGEEGVWVESKWRTKGEREGWKKVEEKAERQVTAKFGMVVRGVAKGEKWEWKKGKWVGKVVLPKRLAWCVVSVRKMTWRERTVRADGKLGPWGDVQSAERGAETAPPALPPRAKFTQTAEEWKATKEQVEKARARCEAALRAKRIRQKKAADGAPTGRTVHATKEQRGKALKAKIAKAHASKAKGRWKWGQGRNEKKKKKTTGK
jgi:hypothetical protein